LINLCWASSAAGFREYMRMNVSIEEIQTRRPVWLALSELFLDTDVSYSYDYIVRECAQSSYSIEQLYSILKEEVAPVCFANLYGVAGEWSGFDEQWLVDNILKNIDRKNPLSKKIASVFHEIFFRSYVDDHWNEIEGKITSIRTLPQ